MLKAKRIPGFENYVLTPFGEVFNTSFKNKSSRLRQWNQRGYQNVTLGGRNGKKSFKIHRLLASLFLRKPKKNQILVRHLDGNPRNNRLENLAWGTSQDNANDSRVHGTMVRGEKVGSSVLTESQVKRIRKMLVTMSVYKVAKIFNMSETPIFYIRDRITWKHI